MCDCSFEARSTLWTEAALLLNVIHAVTIGDDKDDVVVFDKNRKEWRIVEQLKKYGSDSEVKRNPWNQIFPISVSDGTSIYSYAANTTELVKIFSYSVKKSKALKVQIESNVISDWVRPLLCDGVLSEGTISLYGYLGLIGTLN